jgi:hypothetical protein
MNPNRNNGKRKLGPETRRIVRGTHGLAARIAALGHFDPSFASRVVAGDKPASMRFLKALDRALAEVRATIVRQMIRHEHPELEEHARR